MNTVSTLVHRPTLTKGVGVHLLLACGVLSSLAYFLSWIVGPTLWPGFDSNSQAVSELYAIGAPSRPVMLLFGTAWAVFTLAFGFGVLLSAGSKGALRVVGWLLILFGVISLAGPDVPMHQRGEPRSLTDTLHIAMAIVDSALIFLIVGFGAVAFGAAFKRYSIASILVMLAFGALAAMDAPKLAANEPTPWLGLTERIDIGAYLLWAIVLALALWRRPEQGVKE